MRGDGKPDLIVGAPFHSPDPSLYQAGALYVYFGPGYDPEDAIKIPASSAYKGIGFSLAAGDVTNDGIDDLLMRASSKAGILLQIHRRILERIFFLNMNCQRIGWCNFSAITPICFADFP